MILRLLFFALLMILVVVAPTVVLGLCALVYAFKYTAYELIFVAAAIDSYYGLGLTSVPYYTLVTILALVLIEWLKPRFSVYNEHK